MEQGISTAGDHYGIDNEREFRGRLREIPFENIGDAADDFVGVEQSRFDGGDGKGLEEEANLFSDNFGSDGVDGADLSGDFGDDAGDRGDGVSSERADGFEIGLGPSPRAVVRARDRKNDCGGRRFSFCRRGHIQGCW